MKTFFTLEHYKGGRHNEHIEEDLLGAFERLPEAPKDIVRQVIRMHFPEAKITLLLHIWAEQGEDIHEYLVDDQHVAILEVPRRADASPSEILFKSVPVDEYWIPSRRFSSKFHMAIKIIKKLISEASDSES